MSAPRSLQVEMSSGHVISSTEFHLNEESKTPENLEDDVVEVKDPLNPSLEDGERFFSIDDDIEQETFAVAYQHGHKRGTTEQQPARGDRSRVEG